MLFATLYALGHGLVVFTLGLAAILLSANLPKSVDGVMQHFVGATLILLGLYVFYALARHGRDFRMRSRWMLIFSGLRRISRWARHPPNRPVVIAHDHEHRLDEAHADARAHDTVSIPTGGSAPSRAVTHSHHHHHVAATPDDPFMTYGKATSFGIGMIHGVGAETPTQVVIFLTAAGAGGKAAGYRGPRLFPDRVVVFEHRRRSRLDVRLHRREPQLEGVRGCLAGHCCVQRGYRCHLPHRQGHALADDVRRLARRA